MKLHNRCIMSRSICYFFSWHIWKYSDTNKTFLWCNHWKCQQGKIWTTGLSGPAEIVELYSDPSLRLPLKKITKKTCLSPQGLLPVIILLFLSFCHLSCDARGSTPASTAAVWQEVRPLWLTCVLSLLSCVHVCRILCHSEGMLYNTLIFLSDLLLVCDCRKDINERIQCVRSGLHLHCGRCSFVVVSNTSSPIKVYL